MASRRIAGFVVLFAFALSYSEALGAAACSMGQSADATMEMPMPAPAHDQPADAPDECPLSMPGSPSNCIFSSAVLSAAPDKLVHADARVAPVTNASPHYQLLLVRSAFHPPKA